MSFGGAVSAMITSLKNNKRKRVSAFDKLERFQKENSDKLYFDRCANKKELDKIRLQTLKKNKTQYIKNNIGILIIFFILIYIAFVFVNS
ncbi:hypothetical protein CSC81_10715 [Tenacibaculum discolor]|uniref:Uncharacterized protein n=1 Tax=Tenacibaculum discolor TaxID=361581 RepID=A0A2G1BS71_9FLAO|nr:MULTISPECIES: hypothetical protein [Tenacibaculum]MDP2542357.1 hypothetical protein [Tenacibaculum discolor]NVK08363.1 hypothetical protein [Tenacibaculum sp.]PHN96886.1 hypothetical protein CSC81_10715 [Tenacibaculum discolor]